MEMIFGKIADKKTTTSIGNSISSNGSSSTSSATAIVSSSSIIGDSVELMTTRTNPAATTTKNIVTPHTLQEENEEEEKKDTDCIVMNDKVLPTNITRNPQHEQFIPREIHFFVKSRCIPKDLANRIMHHWMSLEGFSVFFHDNDEIHAFLQKPRPDMPFIAQAHKCAFDAEVILDLVRLVWLYEHGGISVDIDQIPGPAFQNGTTSTTMTSILDIHKQYGYKCHFAIEDESSHPYPRFLASEPRHHATYGALLIAISMQYKQFQMKNSTGEQQNRYRDARNYIYRGTLEDFVGPDRNLPVSQKFRLGIPDQVIILHGERISGDVFVKMPLPDGSISMEQVKLTPPVSSNVDQCVKLNDDSFHVDTVSLLNITGGIPDQDVGASCPDGLEYISNTFIPDSINPSKRKIPKIIHMTSKSKCFSKPFAANVKLWRFDGYSFFMHDDSAVHQLIQSRDWPEFPLLKLVLPCLVTGASLADFWRYLALWEYGGLYTDMDNAPGHELQAGTIISGEYDAFFEVERGAFPSQYFFALSPHHPIAYFALSLAIERLILMANSLSRKIQIPQITGPGALKNAMIAHIGVGYPTEGTYFGVSNRSITMVGSPTMAKQGKFCQRSKVHPDAKDLDPMNMTHYLNSGKQNSEEKHSCRIAITLAQGLS